MITIYCSVGMNLFYYITVVYYYRTHPILFLYFFFVPTFLHFLNFFITGEIYAVWHYINITTIMFVRPSNTSTPTDPISIVSLLDCGNECVA